MVLLQLILALLAAVEFLGALQGEELVTTGFAIAQDATIETKQGNWRIFAFIEFRFDPLQESQAPAMNPAGITEWGNRLSAFLFFRITGDFIVIGIDEILRNLRPLLV